MPRFYCPTPLHPGALLELPAGAARHVQVLRLQPGAAVTLFDGRGGEIAATVVRIGRSEVQVQLGAPVAVDRELPKAGQAFFGAVENDARVALAALRLVLARADISSQLIDNLNASIHLRALLTDLFVVDEALRPPQAQA